MFQTPNWCPMRTNMKNQKCSRLQIGPNDEVQDELFNNLESRRELYKFYFDIIMRVHVGVKDHCVNFILNIIREYNLESKKACLNFILGILMGVQFGIMCNLKSSHTRPQLTSFHHHTSHLRSTRSSSSPSSSHSSSIGQQVHLTL